MKLLLVWFSSFFFLFFFWEGEGGGVGLWFCTVTGMVPMGSIDVCVLWWGGGVSRMTTCGCDLDGKGGGVMVLKAVAGIVPMGGVDLCGVVFFFFWGG